MRRELRAEWTKLRTVPGPGLLLIGVVVATVAVSGVAAGVTECAGAACGLDAVRVSLFGVQAGQALVALLAVAAVCGEYGTGMITTTLAAMPRRTVTLAAKATLVTGLTAGAGVPAVLGSLLAGRLLLPGAGHPPLTLADPATLRAAAGSVLYLGLVALLATGVAVAVRDQVAACGAVLGLLHLFPIVILMVRDADVQRILWLLSPVNAGLAVQATTDLASMPVGPWAGLGVVACWAAAALVGGGLLLRLRDA